MTDGQGHVSVWLPQALAEYAGGARSIEIAVDGGGSLDDVLGSLRTIAPAVGRRVQDETGAIRRFVNVYVGDTECRTLDGLRTPVEAGAVIHIIPSVAGGAASETG